MPLTSSAFQQIAELKAMLDQSRETVAKLETELAERETRIALLEAEKDRLATEMTGGEIERAKALRGVVAAIISVEEMEEMIAITQASHERAMSEMKRLGG